MINNPLKSLIKIIIVSCVVTITLFAVGNRLAYGESTDDAFPFFKGLLNNSDASDDEVNIESETIEESEDDKEDEDFYDAENEEDGTESFQYNDYDDFKNIASKK